MHEGATTTILILKPLLKRREKNFREGHVLDCRSGRAQRWMEGSRKRSVGFSQI